MRDVPLDELVRGTVAADGTCVLSIGPVKQARWMVESESVTCTASGTFATPSQPTCVLYQGPNVSGTVLTSTYDGRRNDAGKQVTLDRGGRITAVWAGADPGDVCVLAVTGTMRVAG
jgi:hypothetical protein